MIKLKSLLENDIANFLETLDINALSDDDINNIKNLGGRNIPFEVDGKKYKLQIDLSLFGEKKIAEIKFYLLNNPKVIDKLNFKTELQYQIALKKNQVGITGTGNPFKILTKVLSLLNFYIKDENIQYLTFTANEENRQELYKLIIQKIIKKYNIPYKQCNKNPLTGDVLNPEEFWLEKI